MANLEIGSKAPSFTLPATGGTDVSLTALAGKFVVLYFYPKDDTPGCTKEAIGFTESKPEFDALGAVIVGVSKDTVAKHEKFIAKHALDVTLGSDEDGAVIEDYGVWVEKNMYGKKYMGIELEKSAIDKTAPRVLENAVSVLSTADPLSKARAARHMRADWLRHGEIGHQHQTLPQTPARPEKPDLVPPTEVPRRKLGSETGRGALLHAIAHIELNAIDLAADMIARFSHDPLISPEDRRDFVNDWASVCDDEARHFMLLNEDPSAGYEKRGYP